MYRRVAMLLAISCMIVGIVQGQGQVPTFEQVTGHAFGARITQHHEMVRYLERLAETSPRVSVVDQGQTWEGRRLLVAIVTSPENHARLDAIQRTAQRLGDPRTTTPDEVECQR